MFRLAVSALLAATTALSASQRTTGDNPFPNTKPNGRATVEYKDDNVHVVAIYDYSQRNHDGPWLLVQTGIALRERGQIKRENISLIAPDARVVHLATQEQFLEAAAEIRKLRQNASISQQPVITYFPQSADAEQLRWFALPGEGIVRTLAVVPSEHGVVVGDLYFKAPTRVWVKGTYRFVFDNGTGRAELPIRLE
jgi:hypothetical protein